MQVEIALIRRRMIGREKGRREGRGVDYHTFLGRMEKLQNSVAYNLLNESVKIIGKTAKRSEECRGKIIILLVRIDISFECNLFMSCGMEFPWNSDSLLIDATYIASNMEKTVDTMDIDIINSRK